MAENFKNELKNAFKEAAQDELLNAEELGAVEGGGAVDVNIPCTNKGNCVAGCACVSSPEGQE